MRPDFTGDPVPVIVVIVWSSWALECDDLKYSIGAAKGEADPLEAVCARDVLLGRLLS